MAYINEDAVWDITKVDGYRKSSNLEKIPVFFFSSSAWYTHTLKAPVIMSTTNINMLTSRSAVYTDTLAAASITLNEEL